MLVKMSWGEVMAGSAFHASREVARQQDAFRASRFLLVMVDIGMSNLNTHNCPPAT